MKEMTIFADTSVRKLMKTRGLGIEVAIGAGVKAEAEAEAEALPFELLSSYTQKCTARVMGCPEKSSAQLKKRKR